MILDISLPAIILGAAGITYAVRVVRGRRRRNYLKEKQPRCVCKHTVNYHEDGSGKCQYKSICTCQKYVGPEPLPEYYAPEIGK